MMVRDKHVDVFSISTLHEGAWFNGCTGYKNPSECPHKGVFDPDSPACKECEEDAHEAMREVRGE